MEEDETKYFICHVMHKVKFCLKEKKYARVFGNSLKYFWHSLFFYKMITNNDALLKF